MEEDIKILETVVNYRKFDGIYSTNEVIFKAIENLINRNKELEECLEVTSQALNNIAYDQMPIAIEDLKLSSIPKSKVKEKIEELEENKNKLDEINKTIRLYAPYDTYDFQINILQELLEE